MAGGSRDMSAEFVLTYLRCLSFCRSKSSWAFVEFYSPCLQPFCQYWWYVERNQWSDDRSPIVVSDFHLDSSCPTWSCVFVTRAWPSMLVCSGPCGRSVSLGLQRRGWNPSSLWSSCCHRRLSWWGSHPRNHSPGPRNKRRKHRLRSTSRDIVRKLDWLRFPIVEVDRTEDFLQKTKNLIRWDV